MSRKKVALISDTHGTVSKHLKEIICQYDYIIHAGDIGSKACYEELKSLSIPLYMIKGNCDIGSYAKYLPETLSFRILNTSFYLIHDKSRLPAFISESDVVVFGHTHHATLYKSFNTTYCNPGSANAIKSTSPSFACMEISDTDFQIHLIHL